jgi:hypothetical protein
VASNILHTACLSAIASISVAAADPLQDLSRREISSSGEREVAVTVDVSFGTLHIRQGVKDKIAIVEYEEDPEDEERLEFSYRLSEGKGKLRIESRDRRRKKRDKDRNPRETSKEWHMQFTPLVPLSFDLDLGAGKGIIDLTGMKVQALSLSSGASTAELICEKPNPVSLEKFVIESGVSKFTASNLCNTNFRKLKFEGGVGAYKLDFGGKLQQSADVDIEVGLGAVTIIIPEDVPARVTYDHSWLSAFDIEEGFVKSKKGVYETPSYAKSDKKLTIRVESGLGSVKVRRRDF